MNFSSYTMTTNEPWTSSKQIINLNIFTSRSTERFIGRITFLTISRHSFGCEGESACCMCGSLFKWDGLVEYLMELCQRRKIEVKASWENRSNNTKNWIQSSRKKLFKWQLHFQLKKRWGTRRRHQARTKWIETFTTPRTPATYPYRKTSD